MMGSLRRDPSRVGLREGDICLIIASRGILLLRADMIMWLNM